jgi:hypothetical protein
MFVKVYVFVLFEIVTKHGLPTHGIRDIPEETLPELGGCIDVRKIGFRGVNHPSLQVVTPEPVTGIG